MSLFFITFNLSDFKYMIVSSDLNLTSKEKSEDVDDGSPPFLQLLHVCGLAFELFDQDGRPLNCSLVPAKLPIVPPQMKEVEAEELLLDDPILFLHALAERCSQSIVKM